MTTVGKKKIKVAGMTAPRQRKMTQEVVSAPISMNMSSSRSKMTSVHFKETERFTSIGGSIAPLVRSFPVNPGLIAMFPWLAGIATSFEKYKFHKLVFRYKNIKGTQANGNVVLAFDYDPLDDTPSTPSELTKSSNFVDGAPWRIFDLSVPLVPKDLYTRTAYVGGTDLKTYDFGNLLVGVEGCDDTTAQGYIEVEYHVELMMRQASPSTSGLPSNATIGVVNGAVATGNVPGLFAVSGTVVNLQAGTYIVQCGANPVATSSGGGTITGFTTCPPASTRMFKCTAAITLNSTISSDFVIMRI